MYDAILFLVEGFEEIEAVATLDVLRRGGVNVVSVSLTGSLDVTGSHEITIKADKLFEDMGDPAEAMLILPGGPGRVNFEKHEAFLNLLKAHNALGKKIAAICGAPTILGDMGILANKTAVCYPALESELKAAKIGSTPTVTDGNIITSKAAGTTIDFALEIVRNIKGGTEAAKVSESIIAYG
ncbi:MAG: DJ-1/PfpI family protein [Defluviitaleaceae bacterium]|nr:DJ-1/PfpI family protein [Defluviitaleaceae bacterium]